MKRFASLIFGLFFFSCSIIPLNVGEPQKHPTHLPRTWDINEMPIGWMFTCRFPEKNKHLVRNAFKYWDDLSEVDIFVELQECIPVESVTRDSGIIVVDAWPKTHPDTTRIWKVLGSTNRYPDDLQQKVRWAFIAFYPEWTKETNEKKKLLNARHEVGHALGFEHAAEEDCYMYPSITDSQLLTDTCQEEIDEFRSYF